MQLCGTCWPACAAEHPVLQPRLPTAPPAAAEGQPPEQNLGQQGIVANASTRADTRVAHTTAAAAEAAAAAGFLWGVGGVVLMAITAAKRCGHLVQRALCPSCECVC